jgi:hypothetical protein
MFAQKDAKIAKSSAGDEEKKSGKADTSISFLEPKRANAIEISLARFRMSHTAIRGKSQ